ncbi:MurR/RpiR family transcriptional regulator [Inquilinus sp. NPDC058860]|uniref:MurR/RpiR family transcriptional regulator n=1 Tax=Inquilinus sp. NPDC058860 TaxID=3346652 RepID=UPI00367E5798
MSHSDDAETHGMLGERGDVPTIEAEAYPAELRPLAFMERNLDSFPPALARVTKYVLENPEKVVQYTLRELSNFSRAGEASIVRLCHIVGAPGFSQLKIAVARELALRDAAAPSRDAGDCDSQEQLAHHLAASIIDTNAALDGRALDVVGRTLQRCNRIDLFGSGVSGIIAELFSYRLLRAGLNAHCIRDAVLAHEVANGLSNETAAIAISESGATRETVEFLQAARMAGAFTIAVTCQERSALATHAEAVLLMAKLKRPAYGGHVTPVARAVFVAEALAARVTQAKQN